MDNQVPSPGPEKIEKKQRLAARETLYRVTMQNQLRSIGIADQKGNIIIGINTILISIIIAILGMESNIQGLTFLNALNLNVPLSILLICCFLSGVIALFAVRPVSRPWRKGHGSKLFFRDYKEISLNDFQAEMAEILDVPSKIYQCLNTDMYLVGQTVQRKYGMLRVAYFIFLTGLILAVLSFFLFGLL